MDERVNLALHIQLSAATCVHWHCWLSTIPIPNRLNFFFLFHNFQFHITFLVALWKAKKQLFVSFSIVDRRQLSIHWLWPTDELRNAKVCWKLISNCPFSMQVSSTWNIGHKLYQPKKKNKRSIQKTIFAPSTKSTNNFSFNRKWEECRKCKCGMLLCYRGDKQHQKWYQQQKTFINSFPLFLMPILNE